MYLRRLTIREDLIPHFKKALQLYGEEKSVGWTLTSNPSDSLHRYFIDTTSITEKDLITRAEQLEAEAIANQYKSLRANEYPTIQEQLDMQYWDSINGTTVWVDTINAIKEKYPK